MRETKLYTVDGITAQLSVLCRMYRKKLATVMHRLDKGMSIDASLKTPLGAIKKGNELQKSGETMQNDNIIDPKKRNKPEKRKVRFCRTGSSGGYYDFE